MLRPRSRKPGRENLLHYKTIVLELLHQYPTLDEELRRRGPGPKPRTAL